MAFQNTVRAFLRIRILITRLCLRLSPWTLRELCPAAAPRETGGQSVFTGAAVGSDLARTAAFAFRPEVAALVR